MSDIDPLLLSWQEGVPPANTWVYRDSGSDPEVVHTTHDYVDGAQFYNKEGSAEPWGTARWAFLLGPG